MWLSDLGCDVHRKFLLISGFLPSSSINGLHLPSPILIPTLILVCLFPTTQRPAKTVNKLLCSASATLLETASAHPTEALCL